MSIQIQSAAVWFDHLGELICPFRNLDFTVEAGEWVMITGQNGCGKTTLLRVVAGTQVLHGGTVSVWGVDPIRMTPSQRAKLVFFVSQNPLAGTAADLTTFENLFLAEDCPRGSRKNLLTRYTQLLEPFGLEHALNQQLALLSGGQRQILALIVASLRPARLILLDEPFAALDSVRTTLALQAVHSLWQSGKTVLQVTHDLDLTRKHGTRKVTLEGGQLVYDVVLKLGERVEADSNHATNPQVAT